MGDWEQVKRRDAEQKVNTQERSKIVGSLFFFFLCCLERIKDIVLSSGC